MHLCQCPEIYHLGHTATLTHLFFISMLTSLQTVLQVLLCNADKTLGPFSSDQQGFVSWNQDSELHVMLWEACSTTLITTALTKTCTRMSCNSKNIPLYWIYSITIGHTHKATKNSFRRLPHFHPDNTGSSRHSALIRAEISRSKSIKVYQERIVREGNKWAVTFKYRVQHLIEVKENLVGDPLFNGFKFEKPAQLPVSWPPLSVSWDWHYLHSTPVFCVGFSVFYTLSLYLRKFKRKHSKSHVCYDN